MVTVVRLVAAMVTVGPAATDQLVAEYRQLPTSSCRVTEAVLT